MVFAISLSSLLTWIVALFAISLMWQGWEVRNAATAQDNVRL